MTFETELYYAWPCEMVVDKLGFKCHVNITAMPNSSHMTFLKFYPLIQQQLIYLQIIVLNLMSESELCYSHAVLATLLDNPEDSRF